MKRNSIQVLLPAVFSACVLLAAPAVQAAETVQPVSSDDSATYFQGHIIDDGVKALGYDAKSPLQVSIATLFVALANGDAVYYGAGWSPLHDAFYNKVGGDDTLWRGGHIVDGKALQGYLIDKRTADKYHITNIDQLKDPKLAKLFDIDGDGKADLYGCNPGWGCERVTEHQLDAYKLRDTVTHRQGDYSALISDAIARYKQGKPILFYTWTPNWVTGVLKPGTDVTWLNVPFTSLPDNRNGNTTIKGMGNLGFEPSDIQIVANKKFVESNPTIKKFFELVSIPIADVDAQNLKMHEGETSDADIERQAQEWIKAHQSEWDGWLAEAKKAGE